MRGHAYSVTPLGIFQSFWRNRHLIWRMSKREVVGRYRGSVMGLVWSFLNPLLSLGVYTFVFGMVFRTRWGDRPASNTEFAIMLFAGLIIYTLFADCVNRAPTLILSNVNYVKKVIFPLECLPWVAMGSTLFHSLVSLVVLLLMHAYTSPTLYWTALLLPVIVFPLLLLTMGCCWFLASLGVFFRDIRQVVGIITTVLMFMSPVFYQTSALPESVRPYIVLNPLSFVIEQTRAVLFWGKLPDWAGLGLYSSISIVVAWLGLVCFQKMRSGFADVL